MLFLLYIFLLSFFSGCSYRKEVLQFPKFQKISLAPKENTSVGEKEQIHELVIFIHGTILGLPSLVLQNLNFRFKEPYRYQPINEIGLHEISLSNKKNIGTLLAAYNYQRLHEKIYGKDRIFHFYTFGWSGNLSAQGRKDASYVLYKELINLRDGLLNNQQNNKIVITLHGHSHGGNVIAYLKDAEEEFQNKLLVDQVGLWGTPIQTETAFHFEDPVFSKVYHCYSEKDRVMTLDILSTKKHRSYRRFDKIFKTSDKITQIRLMVEMMHPTHAELWFLGCINRFLYRKEFALYPFPCLHLAPAIFHTANSLPNEMRNIVLNINNQQNGYFLQIAPLKKAENPVFSDSFTYNLLHNEPLQALAKYFILPT